MDNTKLEIIEEGDKFYLMGGDLKIEIGYAYVSGMEVSINSDVTIGKNREGDFIYPYATRFRDEEGFYLIVRAGETITLHATIETNLLKGLWRNEYAQNEHTVETLSTAYVDKAVIKYHTNNVVFTVRGETKEILRQFLTTIRGNVEGKEATEYDLLNRSGWWKLGDYFVKFSSPGVIARKVPAFEYFIEESEDGFIYSTNNRKFEIPHHFLDILPEEDIAEKVVELSLPVEDGYW